MLIRFSDLAGIPFPEKTLSYVPLPHQDLVNTIKTTSCQMLGDYEMIKENYSIAKDGNQLFGTIAFRNSNTERLLNIGFRNSYDKSLSVGLLSGAEVIVCSNLEFSGDIVLMRKHTGNILEDLEILIFKVVKNAVNNFKKHIRIMESLKNYPVTDEQAYRIMGSLYGNNLIRPNSLSTMMDQWKSPSFDEFKAKTMYNLYNAGTFALNELPPIMQMRTQKRFHDKMIGIVDAEWAESGTV